jgi:GAF domain-containing protein
MPEAYAKCVDGRDRPRVIGVRLGRIGQPIITRDVVQEPLGQPWLWLAKQFDYRACWSFPVRNSAGKIVGVANCNEPTRNRAAPPDVAC